MTDHITSDPLTWPDGWKRENVKVSSRFGKYNKPITIAFATHFVIDELGRMGVPSWNIIISSNLRLRNDGLPYSNQRAPIDPGVAVWWKYNKVQQVIALDKYDKVADNLYAVGKTIEAMRGIERWGGGAILDRTFNGFVALPAPDKSNWREVFNYYGNSIDEAAKIYRELRSASHPDKGGTTERFHIIKTAYEQARKELSCTHTA